MGKSKNIILCEGQLLRLINEALSTKLYHWTSIQAAYKIFTSNTMFCQSALAGGGADNKSKKYLFYISMARNRSDKEGFSTNYNKDSARIEFDGDALNQNFAGNSVNYWGAGDLYNKWTYMRHATGVKDGDNYYYKEIDSLPQGAVAKKRDEFPAHPTPNSPDYIKVNNQYFQKVNDKRNIEKSIGYKYEPVTNIPDGTEVENIRPFDFKYPSQYSPDYVSIDDKLYHKVITIPSSIQQHHENEMEDRLFTNKPYIDDVRKYIKRIDLIVPDFNELHDELKRLVYNFALRCTKCYIYDNQDDFNHQTDNTINETIKNIDNGYDLYGNVLQNNRIGNITDTLSRFLCVFTMPIKDENQRNKFIGKCLRDNGFEREIRTVLSRYKKLWGSIDSIINDVSIDIQSISKAPTEDGQKLLGFISKIFKEKSWRNWRDMSNDIKNQINPPSELENIDTYAKKTRIFMTVNDCYTYDVTDDKDTDFWHIFRLDDLQDRYYFIENLIDNLNYATNGNWERDGDWVNNIRNKDKIKFQKYLQNLAHKQVTLSQMFNIIEKIGYDKNEFLNDNGWDLKYKEETLDYFSYKWSSVHVPYKSDKEYNSDARDEYADLIFRKE